MVDDHGNTPLHITWWVFELEERPSFEILLSDSLLPTTSRHGHAAITVLLLTTFPDPYVKNDDGKTPFEESLEGEGPEYRAVQDRLR